MFDLRFATPSVLAFALCTSAVLPMRAAQPKPAPAITDAPMPVHTQQQILELQDQLTTLIRMSPTLMQVVVRDPSLLADQEYVSRSNPQLAAFLAQHPEIARNPDFYLFSSPGGRQHRGVQALRRPGEMPEPLSEAELHRQYMITVSQTIAFAGVAVGLLWLIRLLLENRRWSRVFRQQSEIHGKLIERFSSNQELMEYMNSDAGRRFLEAAPIPVGIEGGRALPGGWARVLAPLQFGIVLSMLGIGLLIVEHRLPDYAGPFLLAAMVALMPGLGFIISAIVTWRLSVRLGLMPQPAHDDRQ